MRREGLRKASQAPGAGREAPRFFEKAASGAGRRVPASERQGAARGPALTMSDWLLILIMIALGAGFALISSCCPACSARSKPTPEKSAPYECGMPPVGDARERQSVKFYLVAMIFLLFDIEVAFLYPWAMALRDLGWNGFVQVRAVHGAAARRLRLRLAQGRARLGQRRAEASNAES